MPRAGLVLLVVGAVLSACASNTPTRESRGIDSQPPTVKIVQPAAGARVTGDSLTVDIEYTDEGSGVSGSSLKVLLNGRDVSGAFDQHNRGASGRITGVRNLPLGDSKITVQVSDRAGNLAKTERVFLSSGGGWITIRSLIRPGADTIASLALSPDGTVLAGGLKDGTVRLWQVADWEPRDLAVLKGHRGHIAALAFSKDGRKLASGSGDGTVRLWDMTSSQPREPMILAGHALSVTALAFSADSRRLASGSADRTVRLWDISGGEPKSVATVPGHGRAVSALAFSPNGRNVASGSADGLIRVWEVAATTMKGPTELTGHGLRIISLAFARDGQLLASSSADRTVRLWDAPSGKLRQRGVLAEYTDVILALAFGPSGKALTAVSANRVVRWAADSGNVLDEAPLPSPAQGATMNAGPSPLATRHENGVLYVFSLASKDP